MRAGGASLREKVERVAMPGPDGAEVATVERDHDIGAETLGERDDGSVCATEWELGVSLYEVGDTRPVPCRGRFDVEFLQAPEEGRLSLGAESSADDVCDLCDRQRRNDQLKVGAPEDLERLLMIGVICIDDRIERP
jgi:hypothetical protein